MGEHFFRSHFSRWGYVFLGGCALYAARISTPREGRGKRF